MKKIIMIFLIFFLLLHSCSKDESEYDSAKIYLAITDSLIKEFNKDSLTVFISSSTNIVLQFKDSTDSLHSIYVYYHNFKHDFPETDSAMAINYIGNNRVSQNINIPDFLLNKLKVKYNKHNQFDIKLNSWHNEKYYYGLNLGFSGIGYSLNTNSAVLLCQAMFDKFGWVPGGYSSIFFMKKINKKWKIIGTQGSTIYN